MIFSETRLSPPNSGLLDPSSALHMRKSDTSDLRWSKPEDKLFWIMLWRNQDARLQSVSTLAVQVGEGPSIAFRTIRRWSAVGVPWR
jgi:hypothetical protein